MSSFVNLLLGVLAGLFVALFIEWVKKPQLQFRVSEPVDQTVFRTISGDAAEAMSSTHRVRFLRVEVLNRALPGFLTWLLDRNVAYSCFADLHFYRHQEPGSEPPLNAETVRARWTATPQPPELLDKNNRLSTSARDVLRHRTLYLERPESIDVCMKIFGEEDCYIFSNENYLHPDLQRPESLLARDWYRVEVAVYCGAQRFSHTYRLDNTRLAYELHLENA